MQGSETEIGRIKEAYKRRSKLVPSQRYSFLNPANLFIVQQREHELIKIFQRYGLVTFEDKKILDVGCGRGGELRNFIKYGAKPENIFGIDLLSDRIEDARKLSPNIDFKCGSASNIPFENESFSFVMQSTVFSSILDDQLKKNISKEMLRVLKPDGMILWFDFHMNNPLNPDVKGVKKKEVYGLFPNCSIYLKRITLAPPIVRAVIPYSWLICYLFEKLKLLNTHYIGIIKKKG